MTGASKTHDFEMTKCMEVAEATSARTLRGGGGGGGGGGAGGGGGGRRKEAGNQADIAAAKRVISMSVKLTRGYGDVCYAQPLLN